MLVIGASRVFEDTRKLKQGKSGRADGRTDSRTAERMGEREREKRRTRTAERAKSGALVKVKSSEKRTLATLPPVCLHTHASPLRSKIELACVIILRAESASLGCGDLLSSTPTQRPRGLRLGNRLAPGPSRTFPKRIRAERKTESEREEICLRYLFVPKYAQLASQLLYRREGEAAPKTDKHKAY